MQISRGKVPSATKCVAYGPEGIGKSSLAAQFPNPLFNDVEGSTKQLDIARTPKVSSYSMLKQQTQYVRDHGPSLCSTYVLDTIDFVERLCSYHVCQDHGKAGIESFGYGNGYTYLYEEFGKFLNLLDEVVDAGVNVLILAHAKLRKFEQPDELGAYDRWELKLSSKAEKNISAMVKEWADMVLFINYKTLVTNVDNQGAVKGKNKVQGGNPVIYTSHHPCWDAKNRFGLPEELPFPKDTAFQYIAHCFLSHDAPIEPQIPQGPASAQAQVQMSPTLMSGTSEQPQTPSVQDTLPQEQHVVQEQQPETTQPPVDFGIPKALADLMEMRKVTEEEIRQVVAEKGYFPYETPISNYGDDFINGWAIVHFDKIVEMIEAKPNRLPF